VETVVCNLCGSNRQTPVYEMPDARYFPDEYFTVAACDQCGLGFVNPRPTIAEIQKYYPADYYQWGGTDSFNRYLKRRFTRQARFLERLETSGGPRKLLDVGCANGEFPRFMMARGWEVEGVEVSEVSERISDFRVYPQEFQEIPVDSPTYDAVTAWSVLEHVHNPMAYFRKASQVLKKDGVFVFLVPNFESTASRHLFAEDIPRHLYFYTRSTVKQYLKKTDFALLEESNRGNIHKLAPTNWLAYWIQTHLRGKEFTYGDSPLSSREYRRKHGLNNGIGAALEYVTYSPSSVVGRMLLPLVEAVQILRKNYGVSTYVGRKL
jgi:2-polyprenyl-3-methyl-5-hydroxy-6-metoxy-1,4-benzoquinol methylase